MGANIDIADVSPEKVNIFLVGKGPLTTSWYVRPCQEGRYGCRRLRVDDGLPLSWGSMPARAGSPARLFHEGNGWRETRAGNPARRVPFRQFRIQRQRILHSGERFLLPLFSLWV